MYIRVSQERVIAGLMRIPGEVIQVDEAIGDQAIRDGYARKVDGRAKSKLPPGTTSPPVDRTGAKQNPTSSQDANVK
ncbi:hypothetical protein [Kineosporia succinea]|uniref:Uncharacterized protein n=1 Tax=Kineosporia succinea TaxID=84632 RepID=A0ABT9NY39_9ACTN|nr:hypothetical protein [Kineosporia succinea]MDP9825226.1 hypothetical protein [Kineosporia succinea]